MEDAQETARRANLGSMVAAGLMIQARREGRHEYADGVRDAISTMIHMTPGELDRIAAGEQER